MVCKTEVLHPPIKKCHLSFLQIKLYILSNTIIIHFFSLSSHCLPWPPPLPPPNLSSLSSSLLKPTNLSLSLSLLQNYLSLTSSPHKPIALLLWFFFFSLLTIPTEIITPHTKEAKLFSIVFFVAYVNQKNGQVYTKVGPENFTFLSHISHQAFLI